jgi:hypothetical protein
MRGASSNQLKNRTKSPPARDFCVTGWVDHQFFPAFRLSWNIVSSWVWSLQVVRLKLCYQLSFFQTFGFRLDLHIGCPGSLPCWLQILGLLSLCNCVRQFLIISPPSLPFFLPLPLSLSLSLIYLLLFFFLWSILTQRYSPILFYFFPNKYSLVPASITAILSFPYCSAELLSGPHICTGLFLCSVVCCIGPLPCLHADTTCVVTTGCF